MGVIRNPVPVLDGAPANLGDGSSKLRLLRFEVGDFAVPAWLRTGTRVQYVPSLPHQVAVTEGSYEVLSSDPAGALTIDQLTLPNGTENVAYSQQLTASNAGGALTWSLQSGAWPAGITMDAAGLISGTPTGAETANPVVNVFDTATNAQQAFSFTIVIASTYTVNANPPVGVPTIAADAVFGVDYHVTGAYRVYIGDGTNDPGAGGRDIAFTNVDPDVAEAAFRVEYNADTGGNYSPGCTVMRDHANTFTKWHWWGTDLVDHGVNHICTWTTTASAYHNVTANIQQRAMPSDNPNFPTHKRENVGNRPTVQVDPDFKAKVKYVSTRFENELASIANVHVIDFLYPNADSEISSGWAVLGCELDSMQALRSPGCRRGFYLNTRDFIFFGNYTHGYRDFPGADSNIMWCVAGGRCLVQNNHLGGATEQILAGAQKPAAESMMWQDMRVVYNHFYNPPEWYALGDPDPAIHTGERGYLKNMFELKFGLRIENAYNLYENTWRGEDQPGFCVLVSPLYQPPPADSEAWQRCEDVHVHHNQIYNCTIAFDLVEGSGTSQPAGGAQRTVFDNNLCRLAGGQNTFSGPQLGSSHYAVSIKTFTTAIRAVLGPTPTRISRNSVDCEGSPSWNFALLSANGANYADAETFEFKGNIFSGATWGPANTGGFDASVANTQMSTNPTVEIDENVFSGVNASQNDDPVTGTFHAPATRADIGWDIDLRVSGGKAWETGDYLSHAEIEAEMGSVVLASTWVRSAELNS